MPSRSPRSLAQVRELMREGGAVTSVLASARPPQTELEKRAAALGLTFGTVNVPHLQQPLELAARCGQPEVAEGALVTKLTSSS